MSLAKKKSNTSNKNSKPRKVNANNKQSCSLSNQFENPIIHVDIKQQKVLVNRLCEVWTHERMDII
ncbi:MAG: hypothetical protein K9L17_03925 [Clostridiales bacterium]|nr:hypothetical protein [Clostridiales bacterium]MCF8021827.1 hypothetical protein [Clostridiales bacterium]